ncbi:endonuclease/exonuclease/phosphatase family protein [Thioclava sp. GXIMD4216]|uniref:endonuclease/exonuclease/phosphatase family protein n=1 Tax=Thioclava sp. GXIMD4216 TaxID=3131929 RepID=UPI0030CE462E
MALWLWGLTLAVAEEASGLRIALWDPQLGRKGPGLLYRDILARKDPQVAASVAEMASLSADVLLLLDFDWDAQGLAAEAFRKSLAAQGLDYPYALHLQPNSGLPSGADLDGNGVLGEARDAQGYGRFTGQGGVLLLSRLEIGPVQDLSGTLWRDMPDTLIAGAGLSEAAQRVQRLSSTVHWDVRVHEAGHALRLLVWAATPPIFDGPEDRNGRRNHDETAFWLPYLAGLPDDPPVVMLGRANLDPDQSEGRKDALQALLAHPRLQDPRPASTDAAQRGSPFATSDLSGRLLRLDYILPDRRLQVSGAGTRWQAPAHVSPRYKMVWVDIAWPCDCARGD